MARMWDKRGAHRAMVGRPKGKRSLGKRRRRREDNINMAIQAVVWEHGVD